MSNRHLVAHGLAVGLGTLPGLEFKVSEPYTYCRLCGVVFQSSLDRRPGKTLDERIEAMELRKAWSHRHAKGHSDKEHLALAHSGAWLTPEAAKRLAPYGIIPVGDLALNAEIADALRAASNIPTEDAEGV